jgi:hypothetical protein
MSEPKNVQEWCKEHIASYEFMGFTESANTVKVIQKMNDALEHSLDKHYCAIIEDAISESEKLLGITNYDKVST